MWKQTDARQYPVLLQRTQVGRKSKTLRVVTGWSLAERVPKGALALSQH